MQNLSEVTKLIKDFTIKQGDFLMKNIDKAYVTKVHNDQVDIVTNLDIEVSDRFKTFISSNFPDHTFSSEEDLTEESKEYTWTLDPIDGTKYFSKGVPMWCINIALLNGGDPILGIIYHPPTGQVFHAYKGGGAYMNNKSIHVSQYDKSSHAQLAWDFPLSKHEFDLSKDTNSSLDWDELFNKARQHFFELSTMFYRIRVLGNGGLATAWTANGFFGVYYSPIRRKAKFSDIAGGIIIAQEAGGKLVRNSLSDMYEQIIIGNPDLVDQLAKSDKLYI